MIITNPVMLKNVGNPVLDTGSVYRITSDGKYKNYYFTILITQDGTFVVWLKCHFKPLGGWDHVEILQGNQYIAIDLEEVQKQ